MKISDNTSIAMPMRNLISIVVAVAVGVWAYFGIVERINTLETSIQEYNSLIEGEDGYNEKLKPFAKENKKYLTA